MIALFFQMGSPAAFVLVGFFVVCLGFYISRRVIKDHERDLRLQTANEEIIQLRRQLTKPIVEARQIEDDS